VNVPLRRPSRRSETGHRVLPGRVQQWQAVVDRAGGLMQAGRPVLIGTDSVADSEDLSAHLTRAGLPHVVLNARHDGDEAAIVAMAGQPGRLTVATNMAGRGTDIPLGAGVAERGGLHVISCQMNGARRIDRQLMGRCARQGDPGSVESILSLDAPLMARNLPRGLLRLAGQCFRRRDGSLPVWLGRLVAAWGQRLEEGRHQAQRALMLHQDRQLDRNPVFRE
jgi:preprotein translocase subunit SecA